MKRRAAACYSPEPKRTPVTDADMNNNSKSNDESYVHGLDFNLNARPADDGSHELNQAIPFHFTPSGYKFNHIPEEHDAAAAITMNRPVDVNAVYPGVPPEFIIPTDYCRPVDVNVVYLGVPPEFIMPNDDCSSQFILPTEPVVRPQMFNFGTRVDGSTGQVFRPLEFYQSTYGGFDAAMVDNTALPVVFLSMPPPTMQVQNLFSEVPPGEIAVNGRSAVHPQPLGTALDAEEEAVTALRLGLHYPESEVQIPVTDYFRMGNGQNNQIDAVANVAEASVEEPKIPEAAEKTEETNEAEEEEAKEKEPVFTCAVCWSPLKEETSTVCGHIFCLECIRTAIKAQKKCPTCRRKLNRRNIHRVYLPTAD